MTDKINIVFYPTIESHFESFLPVILEIVKHEPELNPVLLYFPKFISRNFSPDKYLPSKYIYKINDSWNSIINQVKNDVFSNKDGILFVGNDAGRYTKKLINSAKKQHYKTILLQDGWLEHININKPIKFESNRLKYYLKYILAHNLSPLKSFFGGFIGQSADYAFVYSEFAKNEFIKAGIHAPKIFVTGSPRHQMMRKTNNHIDLKKNAIPTFVFFSTPPANEKDEKEIIRLFKLLTAKLQELHNNKFTLYVKLHPTENSLKYDEYLNQNVVLYQGTTKELLESHRIDIAFSYNSTVIIEALLNQVPVIQLLPKTRKISDSGYFNELVCIENEQQLSEELELKRFNHKKLTDYYLADFNYKHNSVQSVITCIHKILNNNEMRNKKDWIIR